MNIRSLPLQAVVLHDDGLPWYPFLLASSTEVQYAEQPVLPPVAACWSTVPDGDPRPCVLIDEDRLTQLLCLVPNLDVVGDAEAAEVLDQYLRQCRCDSNRLDNWTAGWPGTDAWRSRHLSQARSTAVRWLARNATPGGVV